LSTMLHLFSRVTHRRTVVMRHSLRTGREELTALRFAILGGDFCTAAAAGNLNASDCLPDRDFHSFAGKHRIGEPFLTQFFDALKETRRRGPGRDA
jgi:hypothetical protein